MAGENRFEVGQEFFNNLLAKIPAESRGAVEEAFSKPEAREALGVLGEGVLRQSDYTRKMNENQQYYETLEQWHRANAELVELGKQYRANPNPNPNPNPAPGVPPTPAPTPPGLTEEEFEKRLTAREQGVVGFIDVANELVMKHFQKFGEVIKVGELVNDPKARELGIAGVYQTKFGSKWDELAKKDRDTQIETEVQKRTTEALKKYANRAPYPIAPDDVSPLDALSQPADQRPAGDVAERAAAQYEDLVRQKLAPATP